MKGNLLPVDVEMLKLLVDKYGGIEALALTMGCSTSSLTRWLSGETKTWRAGWQKVADSISDESTSTCSEMPRSPLRRVFQQIKYLNPTRAILAELALLILEEEANDTD